MKIKIKARRKDMVKKEQILNQYLIHNHGLGNRLKNNFKKEVLKEYFVVQIHSVSVSISMTADLSSKKYLWASVCNSRKFEFKPGF